MINFAVAPSAPCSHSPILYGLVYGDSGFRLQKKWRKTFNVNRLLHFAICFDGNEYAYISPQNAVHLAQLDVCVCSPRNKYEQIGKSALWIDENRHRARGNCNSLVYVLRHLDMCRICFYPISLVILCYFEFLLLVQFVKDSCPIHSTYDWTNACVCRMCRHCLIFFSFGTATSHSHFLAYGLCFVVR